MRNPSAPSPSFLDPQIIKEMLHGGIEPSEDERKQIGKIFQQSRQQEPKTGCLAPTGDHQLCEKKTIRSHTVGLSRELKTIASDGMVLGAKTRLSDMMDFSREVFAPIPVRQASAFPGFCKSHDSDLFRPIDEVAWTGTDEQAFLLGYRTVCRELFAKQLNAESLLPAMMDHSDSQAHGEIKQFASSTDLGLEEIIQTKKIGDRSLMEGRLQCFSHAVSLGKDYPVRVAGAFSPERDFEGNPCFDLADHSIPAHHICLCTLTTPDDVLGYLIWFAESEVLGRFSQTFASRSESEQRTLFGVTCFECSEHVYISPEWWSRLPAERRKAIESRFCDSLPYERDDNHLLLDSTFAF